MDIEIEEVKEEIDQLWKKVETLEERINLLEKEKGRKSKVKEEKEVDLRRLKEATGLSKEKLLSLFHFSVDEEKVFLQKIIKGQNEKEKQKKATLCLLVAYSYVLNKKSVKTTTLREEMKRNGIESLVNLTTNLSDPAIKKFLVKKGTEARGYKFGLNLPGEKRAIQIIKDLTKEEE